MTDKREGLEAVIAVGSQWMERAIAAEQAREADQQTITELRATVRRLEREHPALVYALEKLDGQAQTITELRKALAGLATEMAAYFHKSTDWASFPFENWLARYDALTTQAPEADHVGGLMSIPVYTALRQLERHATLLHNAVHNWALHSVADCPEVECEEYRALLSPAKEK